MTPSDAPASTLDLVVHPSAPLVEGPALLSDQLASALREGGHALDLLRGAEPVDRRDLFLTLLAIYDLHTAPLEDVGDAVRFQHHPVLSELKGRLEAPWMAELEAAWEAAGDLTDCTGPEKVVRAMRVVAARDRLPASYKWLAKTATWEQVVQFLALEDRKSVV